MSRKVLVIAVVSACFWATASSHAQAQRPNRSVSRPTLSPYLNPVLRREAGLLSPYETMMSPYLRYFQPDQGTSRRNVTPTTTTPAPSAELMRAAGRSQQQQQQAVMGVAPTGTGSTFMNLSHFYPARNSRR